ncbi:endonuclease III, putative [Entamoeba dispar SAW760]|uniref:Endonuclease III, putative n=1 Tax=Entamoeba dispar (strain ATCC PRA-260 / SAW760) TaxID=370354 RepID=B0E5L4_ENTDS|nr:endonuclease III, putative [Entamoeba dispar SAW760]EDR30183.1 endonuclease III, putative [Entamoeba dispar SAW760]|eukprot:EDR30183.1 endonuclease III, putative [Entamoeba dispar SAW760]
MENKRTKTIQTNIIHERVITLHQIIKYLDTVDIKQMGVQEYGADQILSMCHNKDNKPFYAFIGTFLSPQTRDQITFASVKKLHETLGELTIDVINNTSLEVLINCIKGVGFYTTKAKRLKRCCVIMKEQFNNQVPQTKQDLLSLPGVGPKIASLILSIGFDRLESLAIDTHIFVISHRLGWADGSTPEKVRLQLESWLPKEEWSLFNKSIVAFGQCCCRKIHPKCKQCPIQDKCHYYHKST